MAVARAVRAAVVVAAAGASSSRIRRAGTAGNRCARAWTTRRKGGGKGQSNFSFRFGVRECRLEVQSVLTRCRLSSNPCHSTRLRTGEQRWPGGQALGLASCASCPSGAEAPSSRARQRGAVFFLLARRTQKQSHRLSSPLTSLSVVLSFHPSFHPSSCDRCHVVPLSHHPFV